jgi:hypothetical protein
LCTDLGADLVTDLRQPAWMVAARKAMAAIEGEAFADETITGVVEAQAVREAREAQQATRATRSQRKVLSRRQEAPGPCALPQTAKPPQHWPYSHQREAEAERVAVASAGRAGRREIVYLPAWCREMARQIAIDRSAATRELCHLPRTVSDSLRASARPFGGLDSCAGRNTVALGVVFFWLAKRLNGRLSGLGRDAWKSLTVGAHGKHYGPSALFHPHHRHREEELSPTLRGPYGGRVGTGNNVGIVRAIESEGWLRVIVPDGRLCPGWMVAPSGWPFVQLLVSVAEPSDDSS